MVIENAPVRGVVKNKAFMGTVRATGETKVTDPGETNPAKSTPGTSLDFPSKPLELHLRTHMSGYFNAGSYVQQYLGTTVVYFTTP